MLIILKNTRNTIKILFVALRRRKEFRISQRKFQILKLTNTFLTVTNKAWISLLCGKLATASPLSPLCY